MRIHYRLQSALAAVIIITLLSCGLSEAQQPGEPTNTGEARAQQLLLAAKAVSVIDLGEQTGWPRAAVNATPKFKDALAHWGRYRQVPAPQSADVILQVQGATEPYTVESTDDTPGYTAFNPYLKLTIIDPHSAEPLWTITVPVFYGRSHHRDLFTMTVSTLVSQLKLLDGETLSKEELLDINYGKTQSKRATRTLLLFAGGATGALALAVVLGIRASHNFRDKAQQEQHQFCIDNHIPNC